MTKSLYVWLAFSSCLAAFAALALAIDRHHEDAHGRGTSPGPRRRWLRAGGTAGLVLSLIASLGASGAVQGWVLWFGVLTASALAVVPVLSYAPRWAMRTAAMAALVAAASVLWAGVSALSP